MNIIDTLKHDTIGVNLFAFFLFIALQLFMLTQEWGSIALVLYFFFMLLFLGPTHFIHPNSFIFGYYFLWLVCPAVVDWFFYLSDWTFILPWGRLWEWDTLDPYTLVQIQFTMTTLLMVVRFTCGKKVGFIAKANFNNTRSDFARLPRTTLINIVIWVLVIYFIQASGGLGTWISDYSRTYLTGRAGLGLVNVTIIALGAFSILLAGLRNFGRRGGIWGVMPLLPLIMAMGFVGGFKSRLLILLIFFFLPYLFVLRISIWRILKYTIGFFGLLYVLTLVRSQGFYSGAARFLELIPSYFNVFPLHDLIVVREAPNVLTTAHFPFVRIGQTLGLVGESAEYDVSIMLTKEYFPDQWYLMSATQQWPLETELYLNYYGVVGQVIPLSIYGLWISILFKAVVLKQNWRLYPILALELFRIISTMRGVLIPWTFPILVIQYLAIYGLSVLYLPRYGSDKA